MKNGMNDSFVVLDYYYCRFIMPDIGLGFSLQVSDDEELVHLERITLIAREIHHIANNGDVSNDGGRFMIKDCIT